DAGDRENIAAHRGEAICGGALPRRTGLLVSRGNARARPIRLEEPTLPGGRKVVLAGSPYRQPSLEIPGAALLVGGCIDIPSAQIEIDATVPSAVVHVRRSIGSAASSVATPPDGEPDVHHPSTHRRCHSSKRNQSQGFRPWSPERRARTCVNTGDLHDDE